LLKNPWNFCINLYHWVSLIFLVLICIPGFPNILWGNLRFNLVKLATNYMTKRNDLCEWWRIFGFCSFSSFPFPYVSKWQGGMVHFPHLTEGIPSCQGNTCRGFLSLGVLPTATKQGLREQSVGRPVFFTCDSLVCLCSFGSYLDTGASIKADHRGHIEPGTLSSINQWQVLRVHGSVFSSRPGLLFNMFLLFCLSFSSFYVLFHFVFT
jgi:hypothetical protein